MPHVVVKLRDRRTGVEGTYAYDVDPQYVDAQEFLWHEGNYSCDCNRLAFIAQAHGRLDPDAPCTNGWVEIVEATIDGVKQDWR